MTRPIKFRAWINDQKIMLYDPHATTLFSQSQRGLHPKDGFEMMQFTGLHDRHGREIYEGDVVSVAYQTLDDLGNETIERIVGDVFYCEEGLCFCVNPPGGRIVELTSDPEVIGNIYENK